jgi:putative membrane protein
MGGMDTYTLALTHYAHWGPAPWWPFAWLAVWAAVALVVFLSFRRRRFTRGPEGVLAELFAKGEISESEYRSRRDVLRGRS